MKADDKFTFGENIGLTLQQVYQGTQLIEYSILNDYLSYAIKNEKIPKPDEFLICDLIIKYDEIEVIPNIFDENKAPSQNNVVYVGDISKKLEIYFNHFFNPNWYGIIDSFQKFNKGENVIGGNPEYIIWCMNNYKYFDINLKTIRELEKLIVYRLKGIKIQYISNNKYRYEPVINEEYYKIKFSLQDKPFENVQETSECDFPF